MKKVLVIPLFAISIFSFGQTSNRTISISIKEFICKFRSDMRPTADSAFKIASAILSSPEFQNEISNMTFKCDSYCDGCKNIENANGRISGGEVLSRLFKESNVAITLDLRESGGPLGETSEGSYYTKAWYESIRSDMPEFNFSFAYGLAVNLCHEYMHQVGFCHLYCTGYWPKCSKKYRLNEENHKPDPKFINDDVTYRVGWSAFYILKKWKEDGKNIFNN